MVERTPDGGGFPGRVTRDRLYRGRVATAKIYIAEFSRCSREGGKKLGQKKRRGTTTGGGAGGGDDASQTTRRRPRARAIFSARVVKQQKIINRRDF